jgi:hypothetical protein
VSAARAAQIAAGRAYLGSEAHKAKQAEGLAGASRYYENQRRSAAGLPPLPPVTTYAMVPTGGSGGTIRQPSVTAFTQTLRPAMVEVATSVASSLPGLDPQQRESAARSLDRFGDRIDAMVDQMHRGQTKAALAAGDDAISDMFDTTRQLRMGDATNALLAMSQMLTRLQTSTTS